MGRILATLITLVTVVGLATAALAEDGTPLMPEPEQRGNASQLQVQGAQVEAPQDTRPQYLESVADGINQTMPTHNRDSSADTLLPEGMVIRGSSNGGLQIGTEL